MARVTAHLHEPHSGHQPAAAGSRHFPPPCVAPCVDGTKASAPSSARTAAASSARASSFTTSNRAAGGPASVENIQLRCRAHNIHEAEQYFHTTLPLLAREAATPYSVQTEWEAVGT